MALNDYTSYGLGPGQYFFPQGLAPFRKREQQGYLNEVEQAANEVRESVGSPSSWEGESPSADNSISGQTLGAAPGAGATGNYGSMGVASGLAGQIGSIFGGPLGGALLGGLAGAGAGASGAQAANAALSRGGVDPSVAGYDVGRAALSGGMRGASGLLGSMAGLGSYAKGVEQALSDDMGPRGTGTAGLGAIADQLGNLGAVNTMDAMNEKMGLTSPEERGDFAVQNNAALANDPLGIGPISGSSGGVSGGTDGDFGGADTAGGSAVGGAGRGGGESGPGTGGWASGGPIRRYAEGGSLLPERAIKGPGGGMDDLVPASIDGRQMAALSTDEFVVPADVVAMLGDGSSNAGHKKLYSLISEIRKMKYGHEEQPPKLGLSPRGLAQMIGA